MACRSFLCQNKKLSVRHLASVANSYQEFPVGEEKISLLIHHFWDHLIKQDHFWRFHIFCRLRNWKEKFVFFRTFISLFGTHIFFHQLLSSYAAEPSALGNTAQGTVESKILAPWEVKKRRTVRYNFSDDYVRQWNPPSLKLKLSCLSFKMQHQ